MKNYSISEGGVYYVTVNETKDSFGSDERISDAQFDLMKSIEKQKYLHGSNQSECSFLKEDLMRSYVSKSLASKMIDILKKYPIQMRFKTLDGLPYSEIRAKNQAVDRFMKVYNSK